MNKSNIVCYFFQIRCDMRGHQNRMVFILNKVKKYIKNIIPHHRIEATCRFIQNQQFRLMGKGNGNAQLHFHSLGQRFNLFIRRKLKAFQIVLKQMRVPLFVGSTSNFSHFGRCKSFIEIDTVKDNANVLFELFRGRQFLPPKSDSTIVLTDQVKNGIDGCAFSSSIFANQSHDRSFWYRKRNMV